MTSPNEMTPQEYFEYFYGPRAYLDTTLTDITPPSWVVGPPGPKGDKGDPGVSNTPGQKGNIQYTGQGAPGVIVGAHPGETYLDTESGLIYKLS